jgi:hypothetical protein
MNNPSRYYEMFERQRDERQLAELLELYSQMDRFEKFVFLMRARWILFRASIGR